MVFPLQTRAVSLWRGGAVAALHRKKAVLIERLADGVDPAHWPCGPVQRGFHRRRLRLPSHRNQSTPRRDAGYFRQQGDAAAARTFARRHGTNRISVPAYRGSAASAIAYTAQAISAFPHVAWPAMTADHQMPGTALAAGDPVCTAFATAHSAIAAMRAVKSRVKELAVHWREEFPMRDGHAYLNRNAQRIADSDDRGCRPPRHRTQPRQSR